MSYMNKLDYSVCNKEMVHLSLRVTVERLQATTQIRDSILKLIYSLNECIIFSEYYSHR